MLGEDGYQLRTVYQFDAMVVACLPDRTSGETATGDDNPTIDAMVAYHSA